MQNFLIKFLLLLSTSLSLHSTLALPLSTALAENYQAVTQSDELAGQHNTNAVLSNFTSKHLTDKHFTDKQRSHSTLQKSLLTLLQQTPNDSLVYKLFISAINALDINITHVDAQSDAKQLYQEQQSVYADILGTQHTSYTQKNCYKAKLQRQQSIS